jgi:hypothetical protein
MKTRNGFVSNSSSSSFIIAAKENTLKDALYNNYEEIWGLEKLDEDTFAYDFVKSLKEDWIEYITERDCDFEGDTNFLYDKPKGNRCSKEDVSEYCWAECPVYKDGIYDCREEKVLHSISNKEDFIRCFDGISPNDEIQKLLDDGFKLFRIDIPSDGDGGNIIQQHTRFTFPSGLKTKNISIFLEDDLYTEGE